MSNQAAISRTSDVNKGEGRKINFAHTSGETIIANAVFFSFRVERRRARWYRHAQLKRPAASDAGRRRTATAAPNEHQVRHIHSKWHPSASRLLTTENIHLQPARACMHFFPLRSSITRARARVYVFHLMQKINTHSSKRRICKWCGEPKKRIPHFAFAFAGASPGHLCVYVDMGGYVKTEMGLWQRIFPTQSVQCDFSTCGAALRYVCVRFFFFFGAFWLLKSFLSGLFDVYCGTHCSMALPA